MIGIVTAEDETTLICPGLPGAVTVKDLGA
jgi:hypothetical protein